MKLIDEKEIEDQSKSKIYFGENASSDFKLGFILGAKWTQRKLLPLMLEFAEWISDQDYNFHKEHGKWVKVMHAIATEQLLEQFLIEHHETTKK